MCCVVNNSLICVFSVSPFKYFMTMVTAFFFFLILLILSCVFILYVWLHLENDFYYAFHYLVIVYFGLFCTEISKDLLEDWICTLETKIQLDASTS